MIVIAFDSSAFNNVYYVVSDSPNALEETYALYGRFAKISLFIFVIGLIGTIFTGDRLFRFNQSKDELSIIGGAKVAIKKVEKSIKKGKVSCEDERGNDVDIATNGIYYFYSEDFLYEYSFKSNLINGSRGYVKVVNDNGKYTYYIAFSADTMGLEETEKSQLNTDKVKYNVNISEPKGNMCTID